MADFIPIDQIEDDLKAAVIAASLGFKSVHTNAMDRDFEISQMPLLDIRAKRIDPMPVTNATYYSDFTLELEICAHDMTNRDDAARIRNGLTNALLRFVKDNPRFSSSLESTIIGQIDLGTGESKAEGAFVAGAVIELHPKLYTE